jgi:hypothetical protein
MIAPAAEAIKVRPYGGFLLNIEFGLRGRVTKV